MTASASPATLPTSAPTGNENQVFLRQIFTTWWPLAASWILMAAEAPIVSAFVARLADPEINLAAYGGIMMPLAFIIESPIIMFLAASTALSKDWASFARMRRFMMGLSAFLTALHVLVAFTPLYDVIARSVLGSPEEIIEPGRLGLRLLLPWTWSIAYRRFHQGVLIRFGNSGAVGKGTLVRLSAYTLVLVVGYGIGNLPGIVLAGLAITLGVFSEAVYIGIAVRPILNGPLKQAAPVDPPLTWSAFFAFYIPLVMTAIIMLLSAPINSAALGRMPLSLESLAAWTPLSGLVFLLRGVGMSFNEVVVTMLEKAHSTGPLKRFAGLLILGVSICITLIAVTPLAGIWFEWISGLKPELATLARNGIWFALPLPALSVLGSWFQGNILYSKRTRGLTEGVVVYLLVNGAILVTGVAWAKTTGLYVGWLAMLVASLAQTGWLWLRSRGTIRAVTLRDQA